MAATSFPSPVRKPLWTSPSFALDASLHIETIVADSSTAADVQAFAVEGCLCFPEMTAAAFVRRAGIFLLLCASLATTEFIFPRPLRRQKTIFEDPKIADDAFLGRRVSLLYGFPVHALSPQNSQQQLRPLRRTSCE